MVVLYRLIITTSHVPCLGLPCSPGKRLEMEIAALARVGGMERDVQPRGTWITARVLRGADGGEWAGNELDWNSPVRAGTEKVEFCILWEKRGEPAGPP
jgi:hypothetical protein